MLSLRTTRANQQHDMCGASTRWLKIVRVGHYNHKMNNRKYTLECEEYVNQNQSFAKTTLIIPFQDLFLKYFISLLISRLPLRLNNSTHF